MPPKPPHDDHFVTLIFVINGEDVEIKVNVNEPLSAARDQALAKSHNTGRPPNEWEVRDSNGIVLPVEQKIKEFHFENGTKLFLTLKVGAGGV